MSADLRTLTRELLASAELEPADWLDDDEDAGKFVPLSKLGVCASPELVEYMKLAEEPAFRREVAAVLHQDCYWGIQPVRSPSSLLFRETPSSVVAFLAGSIPLGTDPDSGACLIAAWGSGTSHSAVASFLFDDVAPSDREPGDFVVEALSIESYLARYGSPKQRPKKTAPVCKELARLYRRGIWIAQVVQGDWPEPAPIEELERTVRDASPTKLYTEERAQFGSHPHFAAYWLLSHALFGDTELLADALEHARSLEHPAIVELRTTLAPVAKEVSSIEKVFAKHRAARPAREIAMLRSWR